MEKKKIHFNQTLLRRPHWGTTSFNLSLSFIISFFSSKYQRNKPRQHWNSQGADPIQVQSHTLYKLLTSNNRRCWHSESLKFSNEKHMEVLLSKTQHPGLNKHFCIALTVQYFNCYCVFERHWSSGSANSNAGMRLPQTKAFLPLESFSQIRGALEKLTPEQNTFRTQESG